MVDLPIVTTSSRGQIVIPKVVRKQLNIALGKKILIRVEGERAVLLPMPDDPVEHFCGTFEKRPSLTEALLAERKKERSREGKNSSIVSPCLHFSIKKRVEKVRNVISQAEKSNDSVLMNEVNVGEVYCILFRKRGSEAAEYFINTILVSLSILTVSNSLDDIINAARIKAQYPISYADCIAADTARKYNAVVLTGDPEFKANLFILLHNLAHRFGKILKVLQVTARDDIV